MDKNVKKKKPRKTRQLECPILTAASTPLAPRVECAVFGCRSSDRDDVVFHPLPRHPDRWSQWLKLINRQDLTDKLRSGGCNAVVCSIHFLPEQMTKGVLLSANAVPSLCLPTTKNQFVLDGSSDLLSVPVKAESMNEDDLGMEIQFQPEEPPSYMFPENATNPLSTDQTEEQAENQAFQHRTQTLAGTSEEVILPSQNTAPKLTQKTPIIPHPYITPVILPLNTTQTPLPFIKNVNSGASDTYRTQFLPVTNQSLPVHYLEISPICDLPKKSAVPYYEKVNKFGPLVVTYADDQRNVEAQTNSGEAFRRLATFSAVENLSIPPKGRLTDIINRSEESQTTPELLDVFIVDIKRKFGKELEEAKKELHIAENPNMGRTQFIKGCDKYLNEKIANFVKAHAYLFNKFVGRKYPTEFMIFALKLYLWNPKSYKFVEKFFDLPSKETIQRFRMPVTSAINKNLMECLKVKVEQMSIWSRQCVVCFEVMRLKKNLYYDVGIDYLCGLQEIDGVVGENLAEYAAIIAVRGLYTRWKQPLSFALLSEKKRLPEIEAWLHKTIEALFDIGLNVKALVTSPEDEFLEAPKELYFEIKEQKIYRTLDFLELLKIARNEIMHYECRIEDSVVNWEHILNVYDSDKTQELQLLPNLTDKHVRPDAASKNDVKLAAQLFCSNIAAAMHFYVAARLQNKEAKHTVRFLAKMKDLYEIMYSRKLSKAYKVSTPNKMLNETLEYLKTLELRDNYGNVIDSKFVSALIFSVTSTKTLALDLKKTYVNYLLTKNLTKDFMENYFDYFKRNPEPITPIEFTRGFRKLYLADLLNNTKKTATGDDMLTTIAKISDYVQTDLDEKLEIDEDRSKISISVSDYKIPWPSNEYIAGYLLWKCFEKHTCEICVRNICDYYKFEQSSDFLIENFKFYNLENVNKVCRIRPPTQVVEFVNKMENTFNEYYKNIEKNNINFAWNMYCAVEKDYFGLPCEFFPIQFFKMLYIRLKIFSSVKEYNRIKKMREKM